MPMIKYVSVGQAATVAIKAVAFQELRGTVLDAFGRDLGLARDVESQPSAPPTDEWLVVGRTTIDGTREEIARIVGCPPGRVCEYLKTPRIVGGQWVRVISYTSGPNRPHVLGCEIVRPTTEVEAERKAEADAAHDAYDAAMAAKGPPCPECGPHGGRGMVELLESWKPCTTCNRREATLDNLQRDLQIERDEAEAFLVSINTTWATKTPLQILEDMNLTLKMAEHYQRFVEESDTAYKARIRAQWAYAAGNSVTIMRNADTMALNTVPSDGR